MINEDGSMDAVISIDYFDDILPKGLSFAQAKQWLVDNGVISGFKINEEDMSKQWVNAKATMIGYRIHKGENGMLTKEYEPNTKQWYQNKVLESLMILLKDTENSLNSLYKPIDNDTELVTNVSDYIEEKNSTKDAPYNFGTLHE